MLNSANGGQVLVDKMCCEVLLMYKITKTRVSIAIPYWTREDALIAAMVLVCFD